MAMGFGAKPLLDQDHQVLSPTPASSAACLVVSSSGTIAAGALPPGATWAMPLGVVVVRPPAVGAAGVDAVGVLCVTGHPLPASGVALFRFQFGHCLQLQAFPLCCLLCPP